MADRVPPGAFPEAEKAEQEIAFKTLNAPKRAFTSRRDALTAMRTAVNEHDVTINELKEKVDNLPFPFGVRS